MKLGILTQPLGSNYGGIMQNYALQTLLRGMGHRVKTVDLQPRRNLPLGVAKTAMSLFRRYVLHRQVRIYPLLSDMLHGRIRGGTERFVAVNVECTRRINGARGMNNIRSENFDGYVVGSDQVWRKEYSPHLETYFLDFLPEQARSASGKEIVRVAYAASFGLSHWQFSPQESLRIEELLRRFDAVSVREEDAVDLCRSHLHLDVERCLDPTLLLRKADYEQLIESVPQREGGAMIYILDSTDYKESLVRQVCDTLGVEAYRIGFRDEGMVPLRERIVPSVESWIAAFRDARMVVTDSFHGVVFSILFHKPFLVVANDSRGRSRFDTLLGDVGLEQRLLDEGASVGPEMIEEQIDYDSVEARLEPLRVASIQFLNRWLPCPKER